MLTAHPSGFELRLFHALNFDGGPLADALARALSSRALGLAAVAVLLVIGARRVRLTALLSGLAIAIAVSDGVGSQLLRPWLARQRPCYALPSSAVRWVGAASDVGSMPSLHAANFFAIAVLAAAIDRRLAIPAFALALGVALSRVYLGVHWPADVVAGACWGAIAGSVGAAVLLRFGRRRPDRNREAAPP